MIRFSSIRQNEARTTAGFGIGLGFDGLTDSWANFHKFRFSRQVFSRFPLSEVTTAERICVANVGRETKKRGRFHQKKALTPCAVDIYGDGCGDVKRAPSISTAVLPSGWEKGGRYGLRKIWEKIPN